MRTLNILFLVAIIVSFSCVAHWLQSPQFKTAVGIMSKNEAGRYFGIQAQERLWNQESGIFIDPWGTLTKIEVAGDTKVVLSAGPDGLWNTGDEVRQYEAKTKPSLTVQDLD